MPIRLAETYWYTPPMLSHLKPKLIAYAQLMRLHRPIGILLLLWPTLWALWIAGAGHPSLKNVIIFVLGTAIMRSAGCVINDIADRKFDGLVARTKMRPLITGAVTVKSALILFFILLACAFILVLMLNRLAILLAFVGAAVAIIYPFTKRITHLPQLVLGVAFAWGIPMAFAAEQNAIPSVAWFIFFITWLWIIVYDTEYAMTDRADDIGIGIKSTAILFGKYDRLIIGLIQLTILFLLFVLGLFLSFGAFYYLALFFGALLFLYHQYLIKDREPAKCFKAFLNNSWFGMVIFFGIALSYIV